MSEAILRQRRNLVSVSIFLIFFDFANVEIGTLSFFGSNMVIGNPKAAYSFIWLAWLYFLVRYYQYFRAEDNLGLKNEFSLFFDFRFAKKLHDYLSNKYPDKNFSYVDTNFNKLKNKSMFSMTYQHEVHKPVEGLTVVDFSEDISITFFFWLIIKSIFHVIMHTPKVTDYILPFVIAFGSIITNIYFMVSKNS